MQRRKYEEHHSDEEAATPKNDSAKFRVLRKSGSPKNNGLSWCDIFCIAIGMSMIVSIPAYAISSSLRHSTAPLMAPLTGARDTAAAVILSSLWQGHGDGKTIMIPGHRTTWAEEDLPNRTRLMHVPSMDPFVTCTRTGYFGPSLLGYKLCVDGQEGAFPSVETVPSRCVVYAFSLLKEYKQAISYTAEQGGLAGTPAGLGMELALASKGCEVHVFSPTLTLDGAAVPSDVLSGKKVPLLDEQGSAVTGSITLHSIYASSRDYDPAPVIAERHPDTLRAEQYWRKMRIGDVMTSLGHYGKGKVTLLRVTGMEGHEWPALHDCFVTDAARCGNAVGSFQGEFTLEDRESGGTGRHDLEVTTLEQWAATLEAITSEERGLGMKQVDRAVPPSSGSALLGINPADARYRVDGSLQAAFSSVSNALYDGRVAKVIRATYIRRSVDSIVELNSGGVYKSAVEYTQARKDAFCRDALALAQEEFGADAELNSDACPAAPKPSPSAGAEESTEEQDVDPEEAAEPRREAKKADKPKVSKNRPGSKEDRSTKEGEGKRARDKSRKAPAPPAPSEQPPVQA